MCVHAATLFSAAHPSWIKMSFVRCARAKLVDYGRDFPSKGVIVHVPHTEVHATLVVHIVLSKSTNRWGDARTCLVS